MKKKMLKQIKLKTKVFPLRNENDIIVNQYGEKL